MGNIDAEANGESNQEDGEFGENTLNEQDDETKESLIQKENYSIPVTSDRSNQKIVINKIGDSLYSCDFCDKKLTTSNGIRLHVQAQHQNIKYACKQCDYQATSCGWHDLSQWAVSELGQLCISCPRIKMKTLCQLGELN